MKLAELIGLRSPKCSQASYVFVPTETASATHSVGRVWFHRADADQASKNAFLDTPLAFGDYLVVAMRAGEAEPGNNKHHPGVFAVGALSITRQ
jgi:hypothetical protein